MRKKRDMNSWREGEDNGICHILRCVVLGVVRAGYWGGRAGVGVYGD